IFFSNPKRGRPTIRQPAARVIVPSPPIARAAGPSTVAGASTLYVDGHGLAVRVERHTQTILSFFGPYRVVEQDGAFLVFGIESDANQAEPRQHDVHES